GSVASPPTIWMTHDVNRQLPTSCLAVSSAMANPDWRHQAASAKAMRRNISFSLYGNAGARRPLYDPALFRWHTKAREIGANDDVSREAALQSRRRVVFRRQHAARKFERILLAADRRNQVR